MSTSASPTELYALYGTLAVFVPLCYSLYARSGRLFEDNQSYHEEIKKFRSNLDMEKLEKDKSRHELEQLKRLVAEKDAELEHVKWSRQQLVDKLISARSHVKDQEKQLKKVQVENQRLLAQLIGVVRDKEQAVEQAQKAYEETLLVRLQLKTKEKSLTEALQFLSEAALELSKANATIEHLQKDNVLLQDRYTELDAEAKQVVAAGVTWLLANKVRSDARGVGELVQQLQEHMRSMQAESNIMQQDSARLQQQLKLLEAQHQQAAAAASQQLQVLQQQVVAASEGSSKLKAELAALVADADLVRSDRDAARAQLDAMKLQWDDLCAEHDSTVTQLGQAQQEQKEAVEKVQALEHEHEEAAKKLEMLQGKYDDAATKLEEVQVELEKAGNQAAAMEAERDALREQWDALNAGMLAERDTLRQTFEAELDVTRAERDALTTDKQQLLKEHELALQELEEHKASVAELQEKYEEAVAELAKCAKAADTPETEDAKMQEAHAPEGVDLVCTVHSPLPTPPLEQSMSPSQHSAHSASGVALSAALGSRRSSPERSGLSRQNVSAHELALGSHSDSVVEENDVASFPGTPLTHDSDAVDSHLAQKWDVADLKSKLRDSQNLSHSLTQQLSVKQEELHGVQDKYERAQQEVVELKQYGASLREKVADLAVQTQAMQEEYDEQVRSLSAQLDERATECEQLRERAKEVLSRHLQQEVDLLLQLRAAQRERAPPGTGNDDLKQVVSTLSQVEQSQQQHESVLSELAEAQKQQLAVGSSESAAVSKVMEAQHDEAAEKLEELQQHNTVLTSRLSELQQQHDTLSKELTRLQHQHGSLTSTVTTLKDSEQTLQAQVRESEQKYACALETVAEVEGRESSLLAQLQELQQQHESASAQLRESEQKEAAALKNIEELESRQQELLAKLEELQQQQHESASSPLAASNGDEATMAEDLREYREKCDALAEQLQVVEEKHAVVLSQLQESERNCSCLKDELAAGEQHRTDLEVEMKQHAAKVQELLQQAEELRDENLRLQDELHAAVAAQEDSQAAANQHAAQVTEIQQQLQQQAARTAQLKAENEELRSENEALLERGAQVLGRRLVDEITLQLQVQSLRESLQQVNESLEPEPSHSQVEFDTLQSESEGLRAKTQHLQGELEALKTAHASSEEALNQQLNELSSKLAAATHDKEEAANELQAAEKKLHEIEQQLQIKCMQVEEKHKEVIETRQSLEEAEGELDELHQQLRENNIQLATELTERDVTVTAVMKSMLETEAAAAEMITMGLKGLKEQLQRQQELLQARKENVSGEREDIAKEVNHLKEQLEVVLAERQELKREVEALKGSITKERSPLSRSQSAGATIMGAILSEVGDVDDMAAVSTEEDAGEGETSETAEGQELTMRLSDIQNLQMMMTEITRDSLLRDCANESLSKFLAEKSMIKVQLENELMSTVSSLKEKEEELAQKQHAFDAVQQEKQELQAELDKERENSDQLQQQIEALLQTRAMEKDASMKMKGSMDLEQLRLELDYSWREEAKEEGRLEAKREMQLYVQAFLDRVEDVHSGLQSPHSPTAASSAWMASMLHDLLDSLGGEHSYVSSPSSTRTSAHDSNLCTPDSTVSNIPFGYPSPVLVRDSSTSSVGSVPDDATPSSMKQVGKTKARTAAEKVVADRGSTMKPLTKKATSTPSSRPTTPTAVAGSVRPKPLSVRASHATASGSSGSLDHTGTAAMRRSVKLPRKGSMEDTATGGGGEEAKPSVAARAAAAARESTLTRPTVASAAKDKRKVHSSIDELSPRSSPFTLREGVGEITGGDGSAMRRSHGDGSALRLSAEGAASRLSAGISAGQTRSTADTEGSDFSLPLPPMEGHGVPSPVGSYAPSPRSSMSSLTPSLSVTPRESGPVSPTSSLHTGMSPIGSPGGISRIPSLHLSQSPIGSPSHPVRAIRREDYVSSSQTRQSSQSPPPLRPVNPVTFPELQQMHSPDSLVNTPRLSQSRDLGDLASASSVRLSTDPPPFGLSPLSVLGQAATSRIPTPQTAAQSRGPNDSTSEATSHLHFLSSLEMESTGGASSASLRMLATGLSEGASVSTRHTAGSVEQTRASAPQEVSSTELSLKEPTSTSEVSVPQPGPSPEVVDSRLPLPSLPDDDFLHTLSAMTLGEPPCTFQQPEHQDGAAMHGESESQQLGVHSPPLASEQPNENASPHPQLHSPALVSEPAALVSPAHPRKLEDDFEEARQTGEAGETVEHAVESAENTPS